jgi:hypothetical protein
MKPEKIIACSLGGEGQQCGMFVERNLAIGIADLAGPETGLLEDRIGWDILRPQPLDGVVCPASIDRSNRWHLRPAFRAGNKGILYLENGFGKGSMDTKSEFLLIMAATILASIIKSDYFSETSNCANGSLLSG